jgi:hypothetical protein
MDGLVVLRGDREKGISDAASLAAVTRMLDQWVVRYR